MIAFRSIEAHAEGEPSRVVLGAEQWVRGDTITERFRYCCEHLNDLRQLLITEPRGYPALCAVFILPASDPRADFAMVILEQGGFTAMSGSNTICAVTALLESGELTMPDATECIVTIETAAGLVRAEATLREGKVTSVKVTNVPAFVVDLDRPLTVDGLGDITVDVAFGGQFFVLVSAASLGLELQADNVKALIRAGIAIKRAALDQVPVSHPEQPEINAISLVMLTGPGDGQAVAGRNTTVMSVRPLTANPASWTGAVDRSPCGTGTSARMAVLHARGELAIGETYVHQGILGTTFTGQLLETTAVAGNPAVSLTIAGRGWVTSRSENVLHPTDPFPRGYRIDDIW